MNFSSCKGFYLIFLDDVWRVPGLPLGSLKGGHMRAKILLALTMLFTGPAYAGELPFACEQEVEGYNYIFIVTMNEGELTGIYNFGRGIRSEPAKYVNHSKASAMKDRFVPSMARVLEVDWDKVQSVKVFEVGNYEDDATGVIGMKFLDVHGALLAEGMFFGWAGQLRCAVNP